MCCKNDPKDMSKCHQILRWSMFTVNLVVFCVAAVMMGFAVYMINAKWDSLAHDNNVIPVIMFIVFAVIMLVTTIGALGACNLSHGFLISFIIITVICLILEIVLIAYVAVDDVDTSSFIEKRWDDLTDGDKEFLEDTFDCCGLYDGDSCTTSEDSDDTLESTITSTTTMSPGDTQGCLVELEDWVSNIKTILLIIGIVLLVLQIGGAIVSILILRALKNSVRLRDDSYIEYSYYNADV